MAAEEVLFNAGLVLIPVWLGIIRYIINEVEFESKIIATTVGLGTVFVLFGILFSMWEAIEQMAAQSPELDIGLYVLFAAISLTGIGGVLFIIRERRLISGLMIARLLTGIGLIGVSVIFLPRIIVQIPGPSVEIFIIIVEVFIFAYTTTNIIHQMLQQYSAE